MQRDQERWSSRRPADMPAFVRKGVVGDWRSHFTADAGAPARREVPRAHRGHGDRETYGPVSSQTRSSSASGESHDGQADRRSQEIELEAAVLRRLLRHFDEHKEVQNIELMTLAGFCRNCLSKWFVEAAQGARPRRSTLDEAREKIYGMPYSEWKERYQPPATEEQLARFAAAEKAKGEAR